MALSAVAKNVTVAITVLVAVQAKGMPPHMPAEVLLKRRRKGRNGADAWEVVRARGHLDEVQALRATPAPGACLLPCTPECLQGTGLISSTQCACLPETKTRLLHGSAVCWGCMMATTLSP